MSAFREQHLGLSVRPVSADKMAVVPPSGGRRRGADAGTCGGSCEHDEKTNPEANKKDNMSGRTAWLPGRLRRCRWHQRRAMVAEIEEIFHQGRRRNVDLVVNTEHPDAIPCRGGRR
jgi:hypothetical protein